MALTLARVLEGANVEGKLRSDCFDVTLDNSYVGGGMVILAATVGFRVLLGARVIGGNAAAGAYNWWWDTANSKLMAFYPTGGATASPAAVADPKVTTGASTASAVDATTPNITPGKGKELLGTTDASTLRVRVQFFGN